MDTSNPYQVIFDVHGIKDIDDFMALQPEDLHNLEAYLGKDDKMPIKFTTGQANTLESIKSWFLEQD